MTWYADTHCVKVKNTSDPVVFSACLFVHTVYAEILEKRPASGTLGPGEAITTSVVTGQFEFEFKVPVALA